jgi:tRNA (guanine37-N1)-methyltransferase
MPEASICLKTPRKEGQKTLTLTNKLNLTDKNLQIQKQDKIFICIPIIRNPSDNELAVLKEEVPELQLTSMVFSEKKQKEKTLPEHLIDALEPHLLASLPRALDIIGDIAIVEIPSLLETKKDLVGKAILKAHPNVRVVLGKVGAVSGVYRLRDLDFISGEQRTTTLYKEYGCSYYVDVAKAYFSPRLSHEHKRVSELVQKEEVVADLFAGIGPFSILIAKTQKESKIYAIDINPDAIELLERNIRLNRLENRVFAIEGDAREIVAEKLSASADRIIMNLPETAIEFVDVACNALKPRGGVIHFYSFVRLPETIENEKTKFSKAVEKSGRKVEKFNCSKTIRETAPFEYQTVIDAQII